MAKRKITVAVGEDAFSAVSEEGRRGERIGDVAETASAVRLALRSGQPEALRAVAELVVDVGQAGDARRRELIAPTPPSTGDVRWDALLAGVGEMLALRHHLPVPAWTAAPERFLTRWWTIADRPGAAVSAFTETPAALANRGVFLHASSLESV